MFAPHSLCGDHFANTYSVVSAFINLRLSQLVQTIVASAKYITIVSALNSNIVFLNVWK